MRNERILPQQQNQQAQSIALAASTSACLYCLSAIKSRFLLLYCVEKNISTETVLSLSLCDFFDFFRFLPTSYLLIMLGAQARAAEYNAAKNASARQASREAEEQKLPPKPGPLSLGSFARTAAPNRNKGTKKYAPLILEQTEEDEDALQEDEPGSTTPIKSPRDTTHTPVNPEDPTSGDRIRVRMPIAAPTAPRAMRPGNDPFANQTPVRVDNQPLVFPAAQYGASPNTSFAGAYPYSELAQLRGLSFYQTLDQNMDNTPEGMRAYGNMMVPTDITPTKQEQKLSTMSQYYTNPHTGTIASVFPMYEQPFAINPAQMQYSYPDPHGMALSQMWDFSQQQALINNSLFQRPALQHFHSDITPLARTGEAPTPAKVLMSHHSTDDYAPHITPSRASLHQSSNDTSASKSKENDEPYDRNSKIQLFVAAQQAFAKTGKTVLNNPELRKGQEELQVKPKQEVDINQSTPDLNRLQINDREDFVSRTAPRVPPGLPKIPKGFNVFTSSGGSEYDDAEEEPVATSVEDVKLLEAFGVGTDDWFDLKPVGRLHRQRMNAAVKHVESEMHESYGRPLVVGNDPKRREEVRKWFYNDTRERQEAKKAVEQVAVDHVARLQGSDGGTPSDSVDMDSQAGLIRGAGSMLATLTEYARDYQHGNPPDYFNRTKPVPEFAVEQVGGLGANLGHNSFFEDERGGFYNAPTRIARDPRFRTQAREGGKIKSEDERAYRHDMYGRRRS